MSGYPTNQDLTTFSWKKQHDARPSQGRRELHQREITRNSGGSLHDLSMSLPRLRIGHRKNEPVPKS